jgi:hypothetical protein
MVQDFFCTECGVVRRNRREDYHHRCSGKTELPYVSQRSLHCETCSENHNGICAAEKAAHPERDCVIEKGVRMPYAGCRLGHWPKIVSTCGKCGRQNVDLQGVQGCRFCGDGTPRSLEEQNAAKISIRIPHEHLASRRERCVVTVVCGDRAEQLAQHTLTRMRDYASQFKADLIVIRDDWFPEYPLANKFRLCNLTGAKQYLYFDIDVWLRRDAPNLFELGDDVWMHRDRPFLGSADWLATESARIAREQSVPEIQSGCYNTGVVLFDNPAIWAPPPKPFSTSHTTEQTWVEYRCSLLGIPIHNLDVTLNTQAWFSDFRDRMAAAKIVHLANMDHTSRLAMFRMLADEDARQQLLTKGLQTAERSIAR